MACYLCVRCFRSFSFCARGSGKQCEVKKKGRRSAAWWMSFIFFLPNAEEDGLSTVGKKGGQSWRRRRGKGLAMASASSWRVSQNSFQCYSTMAALPSSTLAPSTLQCFIDDLCARSRWITPHSALFFFFSMRVMCLDRDPLDVLMD